MTHSELISVGWFIAEFIMRQYLVGRSDMLITYEPGMVSLPESPDIIALSKKFRLKEPSVVVECKATRADFLKDRKKPFRVYPDKGMGMFRAYVTNPGIAMEGEVPEGWLLYEVFEDGAVYLKHGRNQGDFYEFARIPRLSSSCTDTYSTGWTKDMEQRFRNRWMCRYISSIRLNISRDSERR